MKILYIHGISRQLPEPNLKYTWDQALFNGQKPPVETLMAYYASILHPPKKESFLEQIEAIEKDLLKRFLNDVHQYLFNKEIQDQIDKTFRDKLDEINEPVIVIGHSLGSAIAWKGLTTYNRKIEVPLFVTLGSPLGINQLQLELKKQMKLKTMTKPWPVKHWENFSDPFDLVAADKTVADEYKGRGVRDRFIMNPDQLRIDIYGSHSSCGYLSHPEVRRVVEDALIGYSNPIFKFFYNLT